MPGAGRRWGFHRLAAEWADRVVAESGVPPGAVVIDLGAGDGALTEPLLRTGARVIAVELHPGRAARLREQVAGRNCAVVTMDALAFTFPAHPVRVVSNPPFAISAALVAAVLAAPQVRAADLVLPRWTVRRYLGSRYAGVLSTGLHLPRSAFRPAATADCAVLRLRRR